MVKLKRVALNSQQVLTNLDAKCKNANQISWVYSNFIFQEKIIQVGMYYVQYNRE